MTLAKRLFRFRLALNIKDPVSSDKPEPIPSGKSVERLFPFLVRARKLIIGREALSRARRRLHSILITTDISPGSKEEVLRDFADYPILQKYSARELETFFGVRNAKVVGLEKSSLAKSVYLELKAFRINTPPATTVSGAPDEQ